MYIFLNNRKQGSLIIIITLITVVTIMPYYYSKWKLTNDNKSQIKKFFIPPNFNEEYLKSSLIQNRK